MSPAEWGPPIWTFFHTLAEKVKEESFREIGPPLLNLIKRICTSLPCPDCSRHATAFLSRVYFHNIKNKEGFKITLFHMHNLVNKRKSKPIFAIQDLENTYARKNVIVCYNDFCRVFQTNGHMKLMADNLQRKFIMQEIKKWVIDHIRDFNL